MKSNISVLERYNRIVMLSGARPGFGRAESKHPYGSPST
jgi:hypothetical protein